MRRNLKQWTTVVLVALTVAYAAAGTADDSDAASTPTTTKKFYVEDIKAAMTAYIAAQVDTAGVFHLRDDRTGAVLALKFVKIHNPVRRIGSNTYFACTDFHVLGTPAKLYDLDFWMNPQSGELKIYDSKVHKEPRWSFIYGWYKQPRYTFVNDNIVSLY